jgi:hypothetical protein
MTARNAGKDERALKSRTRADAGVDHLTANQRDERADDWKSMLKVLIQHARRDLQHGGSKKSALAEQLCASPLLEATWDSLGS